MFHYLLDRKFDTHYPNAPSKNLGHGVPAAGGDLVILYVPSRFGSGVGVALAKGCIYTYFGKCDRYLSGHL